MYTNRTKYSNKTTLYKQQGYDSGFEAQYAMVLDSDLRDGKILSWERQVKLPLYVNDYLICNYYIDFVAHHADGTTEYIECKGYPTPEWKLKWKLFEALYSDLPFTKLTIIWQGKSVKFQKRRKKTLT